MKVQLDAHLNRQAVRSSQQAPHLLQAAQGRRGQGRAGVYYLLESARRTGWVCAAGRCAAPPPPAILRFAGFKKSGPVPLVKPASSASTSRPASRCYSPQPVLQRCLHQPHNARHVLGLAAGGGQRGVCFTDADRMLQGEEGGGRMGALLDSGAWDGRCPRWGRRSLECAASCGSAAVTVTAPSYLRAAGPLVRTPCQPSQPAQQQGPRRAHLGGLPAAGHKGIHSARSAVAGVGRQPQPGRGAGTGVVEEHNVL